MLVSSPPSPKQGVQRSQVEQHKGLMLGDHVMHLYHAVMTPDRVLILLLPHANGSYEVIEAT
jgi:hypothetical protein